MKVVIDIPDEIYEWLKKKFPNADTNSITGAIANSTPYEDRPRGEWRDHSDDGYVECPFCEHATTCNDDKEELHFCFFCGASMVKKEGDEK